MKLRKMITFKSLDKTNIEILTKVFNEAFANYFVTFHATPEYLETRWHGGRVNYHLSFGAFDGTELVGFMMHGIDDKKGHKTAFNIATGVIPSHRGQRLVKQLYQYASPILKENGVTQCGLEVIQENEFAIKAYQSAGFAICRSLNCYSGKIALPFSDFPSGVVLKEVDKMDWENIEDFWCFYPAWEQVPQAIELKKSLYTFLVLLKNDQRIGYAVLDEKSGSIAQFGIHKDFRGQGFGKLLFQGIRNLRDAVRIVNVEDERVITFLEKIGLKNTVNQYEMEFRFAD